ncbi:MAG: VWA domain-containing protein [Spirochaetia bacterium]|nr:VWA domain-containing protein [Spirochaetia bacterium]
MKNPEALLFFIVPLAFLYTILKSGKKRGDFFYTFSVYRRKNEAAAVFRIKLFYLAVLYCTGLCLIIISLSSPFITVKKIRQEGVSSSAFTRDIIFILDISRSMLSDDGDGMSRLEKSKKAAEGVITDRNGRFGVVVFKGDAYTLLPLTENRHNTVADIIHKLEPDIYSSAGTDIGKGLLKSLASFPLHENTEKIIYLFTDGEEPEKGLFSSLKKSISDRLKDNNILLFIIPPDNKAAAFVPGTEIFSTPDFKMIEELGTLPGAKILSYNEINRSRHLSMESSKETDLSGYFAASGLLIFLAALFLKGIKWRGII